jgi:hypothetical protein
VSGAALTRWQDVDVWSFRGRNEAERLDRESAEHVAALREYRRTGAILDCYLVEPIGDPDDDSDCAAGPEVTEIDWTGLS